MFQEKKYHKSYLAIAQGIHNVKDIVGDAIKNSRLLKQGLIKGNWPKIIGNDLGRKTFVGGVKDRTMYVYTENPVLLHQLSFLKEEFIEKTNEFLGMPYIKNIQFKVKKREISDYFKDEEDDDFDIDQVKLGSFYKETIEENVKDIEDDEIKNRIRKLMELSKKKEKYLLQEGNKKCKICGIIFSGSKNICINCYNEDRKNRISQVFEEVKKNPYIQYEELKRILPDLRESELIDFKEKIKEKVKTLMYKEINNDNERNFRYYARIYYILETGLKDSYEIEKLINYQLLQFE
jgi:hypothetical protein